MTSLLNAFFDKGSSDNTNFGQFVKMAGSILDDEQVKEWGETIDWEEPVNSLRRFKDKDRVHVDINLLSPIEVLIGSGDERLVKLLLTPTRFKKIASKHWQSPSARSGYNGGPPEILYINAAINSGSVALVEYVLDITLKDAQNSIFQWSSSEIRNPLACLSDQRDFSFEKIERIWDLLEQKGVAYGSGFHSLSQNHAAELKKNLRVNFLNTATRLGSLNAALVATKKLKQKFSHSHWDELLYGGNIEWAIDFASKETSWKGSKPTEQPAEIIAKSISNQRDEIHKTFANHSKKKDHLLVNDKSFETLFSALESATSSSLIFLPKEDLSKCIGAHLVKWKSSMVADFLSARGAPVSVHEAEEWMNKIKYSPKSLSSLSKRLVGCPIDESADWAERIVQNEWLTSDKKEMHHALLKLSSALGVGDLHAFLRSSRNVDIGQTLLAKVADIQAQYMDQSVQRVSGTRSMRRI